ncbi:hypothetical protein PQJ75_13680 [Rhodoplanes sp. TEM]|uniref:Uncharacterized protein n=1 Tax=Rhodoplanes tepidamans TaxID=200616 RepID=A0ABT5JCJ1_RHOTP|nr:MULTISPECIES: hypothetical protein [Rhodoplanes]MDC7787337.1 hypothetical protein [Rhodoplanes tepidamans]MDC7984781.1 hypothetical protein [Rhodoplanes sp. TEM]MDQ0358248.1 hypothetical protein [Rhodoplanes tepidamans]
MTTANAVSVSIGRADATVSVDVTCTSTGLADALEGELRGMVARGELKLDLSRPAAEIEGEIVR